MASQYSNWTLQKCDRCFDKYFRRFEKRPINNKGMSGLKSEQNAWIQFYHASNAHSYSGYSVSSHFHSLNVKVWYRLNRNTLRGEICVRNISDDHFPRHLAGTRGKRYQNCNFIF